MKFTWICYECNLRFESESIAELHKEITNHIPVELALT